MGLLVAVWVAEWRWLGCGGVLRVADGWGKWARALRFGV